MKNSIFCSFITAMQFFFATLLLKVTKVTTEHQKMVHNMPKQHTQKKPWPKAMALRRS